MGIERRDPLRLCVKLCVFARNEKNKHMKAAVLTAYNKVEWLDVPTPACKSGEVLIRVTYGSICGSDQHIHKGEFHPRTKTPMIMGHEFAGVFAEVARYV